MGSLSPLPPTTAPSPAPPPTLRPTRLPTPSKFPPPPSAPSKLPKTPSKTPALFPLHSKNPHILNRDLRRLARLDKLPEALTLLDYLDHRGVPVSPTSFSSLLLSSSRLRSLPSTRLLHSHINTHNLSSNEFLLHRLVEAYSACGSPDEARELLDQMPNATVYAWNALLKGNATHGRRWSVNSMNTFDGMRSAGVEVNGYTFSCLIKSLAGSLAFAQGTRMHALLIKKGMYANSVMLQTSLIDMYFKCGRIKWAWKVFDEMRERDVVVWGAMISGFAHKGMRREALEYLRRMVSQGIEMNSVIVTSVLPVVGEMLDRSLGREIHGYMIRRYPDFKKMMFVLSGLIDMYCKCGDMVSARHVFYGSTGRNVVSWTALISGYASNGRLEQALRSTVWMQHEGIQPDVVTVATVLPICTQLKALKRGKEIHAYALKNWFIPNSSVETSLVNMYAECGKLDYSCRVFDGMRNKNVIAWTALIDSYIKNDHLIDALDVFRSMRLVHHNPDAVALGRVLSISGNLKALRTGKEIHAQVYKMKLESTPFLVGEIVKMYGKNADTENAKKVFDGVHSKGSLTCTAIIEAYGYNGRYREAIDLFDWMQSQGYVPNHFTFDAILGICERAGFVKEAVDVFDSMVKKYKLKATEGHCDSIIGLLTRTGRVMEAQRFIYLKSTLGQM